MESTTVELLRYFKIPALEIVSSETLFPRSISLFFLGRMHKSQSVNMLVGLSETHSSFCQNVGLLLIFKGSNDYLNIPG